jgi:hypothetical protein
VIYTITRRTRYFPGCDEFTLNSKFNV